ncbi:hypothetical protein GQX73_g9556 [Xylaria multiplex]|uniref:Uncharacterized protein n=1 Tax=Xylaria multiplex TaxID=323545 RepID=A0A7C8MNK1_9PEZI|nr:hypothetical protein GQX73_g9556 [Xylaria multiplex]
MPPVASSYQSQVQTEIIGKPQNRLEGTGPYGATLKQGVLSKPLTHTQKQLSVICITKSEIEIKGNVEDSVVAKCVQNEGVIEFEIESKEAAITDSSDDATVVDDFGPAPNAVSNVAIMQSVVGIEIKTKDPIMFTPRPLTPAGPNGSPNYSA